MLRVRFSKTNRYLYTRQHDDNDGKNAARRLTAPHANFKSTINSRRETLTPHKEERDNMVPAEVSRAHAEQKREQTLPS